MRKFKINLTKSVEASVYFDENDVQNTTPKLVSIKPRSGVDSSVTSYSINKLSANIKNISFDKFVQDSSSNNWHALTDSILELALYLNQNKPTIYKDHDNNFDKYHDFLNKILNDVNLLRDELNSTQQTKCNDVVCSFYTLPYVYTFHKRTGLYFGNFNNRQIIGLPYEDKVFYNIDNETIKLSLFDRETKHNLKMDGTNFDDISFVKVDWPVRFTKDLKPRQISAAIGALQARFAGEHVTHTYSFFAKTLNIPHENPTLVQRHISSVIKIMLSLDPLMLDMLAFLSPPTVNFNNLFQNVKQKYLFNYFHSYFEL